MSAEIPHPFPNFTENPMTDCSTAPTPEPAAPTDQQSDVTIETPGDAPTPTTTCALEPGPAGPPPNAPAVPPATGPVAPLPQPLVPALSPRIVARHSAHKQLEGLFTGVGKKNGQPLPSPAAYDEAYVERLVMKCDVTDEGELAAAVMCRPDGHAARQGEPYARGLAQAAAQKLAAVNADKQATSDEILESALDCIDFKVERVRVFESDESRYEFTIRGKTFALSAKSLSKGPEEFKALYLGHLHEPPQLPAPKATSLWDALVGYWLKSAEVTVLKGDATDEAVLQREVTTARFEIHQGKSMEALLDDMAFSDGKAKVRYFTEGAVTQRVRAKLPKVQPRDVVRVLEKQGCTFHASVEVAPSKNIKAWSESVQSSEAASDSTSMQTPAAASTTAASASEGSESPTVDAANSLEVRS